MIKSRVWLHLLCGLAVLIAASSCAPMAARSGDEPRRTVRLMLIGNSFSHQGTFYLREMARENGHNLIFGHAQSGGYSLQRHLAAARAYEADPEDPEGTPYTIYLPGGKTRKASLKELLQSEPWDYVSIQQFSVMCTDPLTYRPTAAQLVDYIHQYAPQAKLVLHETWAYRADDPLFADDVVPASPKPPMTQERMYQKIHENYQTLARELGAVAIVPSGAAFENARHDPRWQLDVEPNVEAANYTLPDLPRQTHALCVGYYWNKTKKPPEFAFDGHHITPAGRYLASAVWYEVFLGDARRDRIIPTDLTAEEAASLREIAHNTVQQHIWQVESQGN